MRIGYKMALVRELVQLHPGHPMCYYAARVGPHGSLNYGYRTVHRAIRAGIVRAKPGTRRGVKILSAS